MALLRALAGQEKRATLLQLCEQWKDKAVRKEDKERAVVQLLLDGVLQEEFGHTAFATNSYITRGPSLPLLEHGESPSWGVCAAFGIQLASLSFCTTTFCFFSCTRIRVLKDLSLRCKALMEGGAVERCALKSNFA